MVFRVQCVKAGGCVLASMNSKHPSLRIKTLTIKVRSTANVFNLSHRPGTIDPLNPLDPLDLPSSMTSMTPVTVMMVMLMIMRCESPEFNQSVTSEWPPGCGTSVGGSVV
jgi:hypothetical protein